MTLVFVPSEYGLKVPRGQRSTVWTSQSCIRISKTSPAWSAKSTLSGTTTAARPPFFRMVRTCCRKLSCLLLVWTTKSSRSGDLRGSLGAERRVHQDDIKPLAARRVADRVAEGDLWLDLVEVEVHQGQATRTLHELVAVVRLAADPLGQVTVERATLRLVLQPLVCGDEEASRADSRVADLEVAYSPAGQA